MVERNKSKLMPAALILSGLEGLGVLANLVLTKSAEGSVFLGLSATRLALSAGVLVISAVLLWLGISWGSDYKPARRIRQTIKKHSRALVFIFAWGSSLFLILQSHAFYQIIFRPFKRLLSPELFPQLRPMLIWAGLILIQVAIGITLSEKDRFKKEPAQSHIFLVWLLLDSGSIFQRPDQPRWQTFWQKHKASLLIFLGMILVWAGVAITGIGVQPDNRFWNIAGTPFLWHQVVLTFLLILFVLDLKQTGAGIKILAISRKPAFPYILMALIWLAAVLVWQGQPLQHTYFAVNEPPNNVSYPFSDAMWFDIGGQYFLMGEGLYNNQLTDRPYLMLYDAFLHVLVGQQYEKMIFIQIMLLALIPVISFLIGWKLHSKTAGAAGALLIILKEKNAIAAAFKTGLANPKVLTSEMPNALILVLVTLCLLYWFRQRQPKPLWPILAGGLTGLAIGVRGSSLTVIPLVILLALLVLLREQENIKHWALVSLFFLLGVSAVLTPYSIETTQKYGAPFWLVKIQNVIDRGEFEAPPEEATSRLNRPAQEPTTDGFVMLTLRHFIHNEITTVLMLPIRWQANPLKPTLEHPIWDGVTKWDGTLTPGEKIALGLNLLILAFGIGFTIHRWQIIGLVPLGIHLTYNLTSSMARTSGGRYLVPTDWVLPIYFILGILALIFALRQWTLEIPAGEKPEQQSKKTVLLPILSLVGFLLVGSAYLLSDSIPQPYDLGSVKARQAYLNTELDKLTDAGIDPQQVKTFISTKGTVFSIGMALYPRYYQAGEDVPISSYLPDIPPEDAHLYFMLLEDNLTRHVSIPLLDDDIPTKFPHGEYGLVIGCEKEEYTEGIIFIPLGSPDSQIFTQTEITLSCD